MLIDDIANAVSKLLAEFEAQVAYSAEFDLHELEKRRCVVVPVSSVPETVTRKCTAITHTIEIGLLYKGKKINVPDLIGQVKQIAAKCHRLKVGNATCVQAEFAPLYDQDQLRTRGQFTGVVALTFKEFTNV